MTPPSRIKVLKIVRAALAIYLIGLIALDAADLIAFGRISALIVVVPVFMLAVITLQTFVIRRDKVLSRPRADYSAIARMEREVYGETFEHEGAPRARGIDPGVAELNAMMDDLAERGTARLSPCWCNYCKGRKGVHGEDAIAVYRAECDTAMKRTRPQRWDGRTTHPDTTEPATVEQYVAWLEGYIKRGGKPTHFYDAPFSEFRYASSRLIVDSDYEYGSSSRHVIVAKNVTTGRTNPAAFFDGWAHTSLYFMHGYRTNRPDCVPIYSDPEFDQFRRDSEHRSNLRWERPS